MNRSQLPFALLLAAVLFTAAASTVCVVNTLQAFGIDSVFTKVSLSDSQKMYVSLQLTLTSLSVAMLAFGVHFWHRLSGRIMAALAASSSVLQASSGIYALVAGFGLAISGAIPWVFGIALSAITAIIGLNAPRGEVRRAPLLLPREVAVSSVLSALTAVIIIITGALVPSPTGGYTHVGDMVIFVAALLFGSKVGGITGVVGSVIADFWLAYPRWYVSIPAHGLEGIIAGFARNKPLPIQVVLCTCAGLVMASTYFYVNIFIKGYPLAIISYARDIFGQAGISMVLALTIIKSVKRIKP